MEPALAPAGGAGFAAELLLAKLPQAGGFFLLAFHARLFVVLTTPCLSQDSVLLDALVKALEGGFEVLAIADDDFCQKGDHLAFARGVCSSREEPQNVQDSIVIG